MINVCFLQLLSYFVNIISDYFLFVCCVLWAFWWSRGRLKSSSTQICVFCLLFLHFEVFTMQNDVCIDTKRMF